MSEASRCGAFGIYIWIIGVTLLVILNMFICQYYGRCLIADDRHVHGENFFSFLER
jgi:hypothetical protein